MSEPNPNDPAVLALAEALRTTKATLESVKGWLRNSMRGATQSDTSLARYKRALGSAMRMLRVERQRARFWRAAAEVHGAALLEDDRAMDAAVCRREAALTALYQMGVEP